MIVQYNITALLALAVIISIFLHFEKLFSLLKPKSEGLFIVLQQYFSQNGQEGLLEFIQEKLKNCGSKNLIWQSSNAMTPISVPSKHTINEFTIYQHGYLSTSSDQPTHQTTDWQSNQITNFPTYRSINTPTN